MSSEKLRIVRVPIDSLSEDPTNARAHGEENLAAVEASLREHGQVEPLVVRKKGRRLIGGHGRLAAMRRLGWTHADVVLLDVDEDEARKLNLRLNRTAELAEWDDEKLGAVLREIDEAARADLGWDEDEITALIGEAVAVAGHVRHVGASGSDEDGDAVPTPEGQRPASEPGGVYRLGRHVLICGDSLLDEETFSKVFEAVAGRRVCVVTDPPYAIYGSSTGADVDGVDDRMTRPAFARILERCERILADYGDAYVFTDWRSWASLFEASRSTRMRVRNGLTWDKGDGGLGHGWLLCSEWIAYLSKTQIERGAGGLLRRPDVEKTGVKRAIARSNVLRFNRTTLAEKEGHNAAKPIDLLREIVRFATDPGDVVIDFFGGSGTIPVACEAEDRASVIVEVEPKWCDAARRRWANYAIANGLDVGDGLIGEVK